MRKILLRDVVSMAKEAAGNIDRIFLHWSAGHYDQFFADYHLNIDQDGNLHTNVTAFTENLSHTWHQNTGSVGISMSCCFKADFENLGPEPPTELQIESMAQVIALLCREFNLPITINYVRTHAEQANIDGYGPDTTSDRWDLWFLHVGDAPGSGGDILRGKAKFYLEGELAEFGC